MNRKRRIFSIIIGLSIALGIIIGFFVVGNIRDTTSLFEQKALFIPELIDMTEDGSQNDSLAWS